jgi:L-threonylcarbamoyladenylate synthase
MIAIVKVMSANQNSIELASNILLEGGVVCIPTDTVYGLAASAVDPDAIASVFNIKGRMKTEPLPLLVDCSERIVPYVKRFSSRSYELAEKYWPGALTIIFEKSDLIPDTVTAGMDTVGFRVPDHFVPAKISSMIEGPVTGTSANKSGCKPATSAEEAYEQLVNTDVDLILDSGPCEQAKPSTIVDGTGAELKVLREGMISKKEILRTLRSM